MATTRTRRSTSARGTTTRAKSEILEIDFDDYEGDGNAYMGDDPRPGVYGFGLVNVEKHTSQAGKEGIRWTFECTDPAYEGWRGFMYSNMDPDGAKFKTQQIVKAVRGGKEEKVALDLAKPDKFLAACSPVVGRVISDSWEDEESGEVRNNSKLIRVVAESAAPKRGARKAKDEDEDGFEGDDGFDDADADDEDFDEDDFRADLEEKTLAALKKMAKEEYDIPAAELRGISKEDLVDMLVEEETGDGDDDDSDDDGDDADSENDADDDADSEPEEAPAPPARRRRAAAPAAKTTPAKKATTARRRRG